MLSRSVKIKETKGATLRVIVLVSITIIYRLSLIKSLVILKKRLRLNFTNIKAFSNNLIKR